MFGRLESYEAAGAKVYFHYEGSGFRPCVEVITDSIINVFIDYNGHGHESRAVDEKIFGQVRDITTGAEECNGENTAKIHSGTAIKSVLLEKSGVVIKTEKLTAIVSDGFHVDFYDNKGVPLSLSHRGEREKNIYALQKELEQLQEELKNLEVTSSRYDFICTQVNRNIQKLGSNVWYTGRNADDIRNNIKEIKNMEEPKKKGNERNIADLEVMYNNISEQIKTYENAISDAKQFENDNANRKILLESLEELLAENKEFAYLVEPLKMLLSELDNSISFSQYTISDKTITELKKQRIALKTAIKRNDSRFQCYTLEEKAKAITLIEEYLSADIRDCSQELNGIRKKIREIKEEIRILQNSDDIVKIRELASFITELYRSAKNISSVVDDDILQEGFKIQYLKRGNILQPMIQVTEKDENGLEQKKEVNYYIGSMARHTLIQLCGYFGFLKILLAEEKYPIIPFLVIDHISKPFDASNAKAIGQVIEKAYTYIGKENLQIFMFDDEEYSAVALQPEHFENLVSETKSGFNPFYYAVPEKSVNSDMEEGISEVESES